MANTYTQLYIQFVFAVKHRQSLIKEADRNSIEKFITGIIQNRDHKLLAIYCMPDHCHILCGINPKQSISDLARDIKSGSSKWINEQGWENHRFGWQEGYGAFSYSKSQLNAVINYIQNQPKHHKNKTFHEEYIDFLEKFAIDYKTEYLFDNIVTL